MTLVLTEVSRLGVAMAADSAVTFRSASRPPRVYIGAQKLLPAGQIDAGLSVWGKGDVNGVDADIWLANFIKNDVADRMSLWDMATKLAEELNEAFSGVIDERMGIHIGGFDERNGIRGPAFYHVHNQHHKYRFHNRKPVVVEEEPIREFAAHKDRPPSIYAENDYSGLTRNGDFAIFALLHDEMRGQFRRMEEMTSLVFPYPPSLDARGEHLRFWINTVKEVYRLSNYRRDLLPQPLTVGDAHIGGPVTVLTISESGIERFYSR